MESTEKSGNGADGTVGIGMIHAGAMLSKPRYEGVEFRLGGETLIFPPLSLGQLRRLEPMLAELRSTETPDTRKLDIFVIVIQEALNRNYPDRFTTAVLLEELDTRTVYQVIRAVMDVSGLVGAGGGAADSPLTGTRSIGT